MIEYISFALPLISLFLYAVLFCIECGASIFVWTPHFFSNDAVVRSHINPIRETTNVFLIFTLISVIAFFPGAFLSWSYALIIPFFIFLLLMSLRAIGLFYIFYRGLKSTVMKIMFSLSSLLAPAVLFGGTVPFFLKGTDPLAYAALPLTIAIAISAIASTMFLSSVFFDWLRVRKGLHENRRIYLMGLGSFMLFFLSSFFTIYMLKISSRHVFNHTVHLLPAIALVNILELFTFLGIKKFSVSARFWIGIVSFGSLFWTIAIASLPYIIYPSYTIFDAFTDMGSAKLMLAVSSIGIILTIPSLFLLYSTVMKKEELDKS